MNDRQRQDAPELPASLRGLQAMQIRDVENGSSSPVSLSAGASVVDWTPQESVHLAGYPHAKRMSTGTHDPLLAAALCVGDGREIYW